MVETQDIASLLFFVIVQQAGRYKGGRQDYFAAL